MGGGGDLHTCDLNMPLFVQEDAGRKGRKTDALRRDTGEGTRTPGYPPRPRGAVSMPDRGCLLAPGRCVSGQQLPLGRARTDPRCMGQGAPLCPCACSPGPRGMAGLRPSQARGDGFPLAPRTACLPCENRAGMGQERLSCADTEPLRDLLSPGGRWLAGAHSLSLDLPGSPVLALGTSPELQGNP